MRCDKIRNNTDTRTYIFIETPDGRGGVLRQQSRPVGFPLTWGAGIGADYEMDQDVVNDPGYRDEIADDFLALPSMSIVSDLDNFFHPSPNPNLGGIYSNPRSSGQRWERPCSMELIYPDGSRDKFGPGQAFLLPQGFTGTWHQPETVIKYFVMTGRQGTA